MLTDDGLELGRVVGHQLSAVARPARLDVQRLLRRKVRMPSLHGGGHVIHPAALEGVRGRRLGVVELAQLRDRVRHATPSVRASARH